VNIKDPIASSTLAHLYVAQGHVRQAAEILRQVLARDPFDGHALCLTNRLKLAGRPVLTCAVDRHSIDLVWHDVPPDAGLYALMITMAQSGATLRTRICSVQCTSAGARWSIALPSVRGSVCACLGRVHPGQGFVAHAVARPCSWDGD
jgi:hypothetical protein